MTKTEHIKNIEELQDKYCTKEARKNANPIRLMIIDWLAMKNDLPWGTTFESPYIYPFGFITFE